MKKINRKEFLGLAGVTVGLASGITKLVSKVHAATEEEDESESGESTYIFSTCQMCEGESGIRCRVVDGTLVKIEPSSCNPVNFSNSSSDFFAHAAKEGAGICPKGNAGIATLYDRDRLQKPLKRTNSRKGIGIDPGWQEISWQEAYDEIAGRLKKLRESGEAHKLLAFSDDASGITIQDDFYTLFGTPNFFTNASLHDAARRASYRMAIGYDRPLIDAVNSKYILLFGWNPLSATKWAYLPRIITRAIEKGAKLVVVDPHLSLTANKAREWVPIRPGTDGAMALAMAQVIIRRKLYDEAFINNWTVGFERYAQYVKDKTPEWQEEITSVPAKTVERLAVEFAATRPQAVDFWAGTGHHSNGVQSGRAIALLAALVGAYDRPGTLLIPGQKGRKHVARTPDDRAKSTLGKERFDGKKAYPFGDDSGIYSEVFARLAEGKGPYRPKMAILTGQNPMMDVPGTAMVEKAFQNLEFTVVNDIFMSETALMADIVIPGTTYLERYDLSYPAVSWPVVALRQPVVKPLFDQPAEYEFLIELGRRLQLKGSNGADAFLTGRLSGRRIEDTTAWYEEFLSRELKESEANLTLEELRALEGAVWVSKKGTRYEKFKESGFPTPSGKIEFSNAGFAGKKDSRGKPVNAVPAYEPDDWQPDDDFPLYLITWEESAHTGSSTQNNTYLVELMPENRLIINPETAEQSGLKDDDAVYIESKYGKVRAKVKLARGIHPQVVGLHRGFGHWASGEIAKNRGFSDAPLRPTQAEPLAGQATNQQCCVKVYKA